MFFTKFNYFLFNKCFDAASTGEAMRFIIERNLLEKNKPKVIKIIINSPGGCLNSAFALIDTMKGSSIPIYTYGLGLIASAGLLTFMAGERGHRYITRNTAILSHQYSWGSIGKEHELMSRVKEFENTESKTAGGLIVAATATDNDLKKGLVVKVGPGERSNFNGELYPVDTIKDGMVVYYSPNQATEVKDAEGNKYYFVNSGLLFGYEE